MTTNAEILAAIGDVKSDVDSVRTEVGRLASNVSVLRNDFDGYVVNHEREHENESERFVRVERDIKEMMIDVKKILLKDARTDGKNDVLRFFLGITAGVLLSAISIIMTLVIG